MITLVMSLGMIFLFRRTILIPTLPRIKICHKTMKLLNYQGIWFLSWERFLFWDDRNVAFSYKCELVFVLRELSSSDDNWWMMRMGRNVVGRHSTLCLCNSYRDRDGYGLPATINIDVFSLPSASFRLLRKTFTCVLLWGVVFI